MLQLKTIPHCVINLPDDSDRRQNTEQMFGTFGVTPKFYDGHSGGRKVTAVASAYRDLYSTLAHGPVIVMEDDLVWLAEDYAIPTPPSDADLVYLFTHPAGTGLFDKNYVRHLGWRSAHGLTLSQEHDENYVRLWSMIGGLAILLITDHAIESFRNALQIGTIGRKPADVAFSNTLRSVKAYALKVPHFAEDMALQRETDNLESRARITRKTIQPNSLGDVFYLSHPRKLGDKKAKFEVVSNDQGAWFWKLLNVGNY